MKLGTLIPTLAFATIFAASGKWWWALGVLVCGGVATGMLYWRGVRWLEK